MKVATSVTVRVSLTTRHRPGRKTIVTPDGIADDTSVRTRTDPALVKALGRAFRWKKVLDNGRYASISELASAEKIDRSYAGSVLRLTLLAPDIVEAILDGRQPAGLGLPALLKPFPLEWDRQRSEIMSWADCQSLQLLKRSVNSKPTRIATIQMHASVGPQPSVKPRPLSRNR